MGEEGQMSTFVETLRRRVLAARREAPADLVLKGGRVANVFSGEVQKRDVAICDDVIVGLGPDYHGKEEVELDGDLIIPGLIDAHFHIESSMLLPSGLAAPLLLHGTTAIVSDPHEIANVMGVQGVRFLIDESRSLPFDIFFLAPSCVPATHLETSGATLQASDLAVLKDEPSVLGLAEMMNVPGLLVGDEKVLEKIVLFKDLVIDGHCPLLKGYDLQAYLSAGIRSDHEITEYAEAQEKLESGMMVMIREGSSARNLEELLPLVTGFNARRFCFVSDDLHAEDLLERGHLDFVVRKAVKMGLPPITAIQLATLNPAEYFGLRDRGAVAPGYRADLVVLDDFENFHVSRVYKDGRLAVEHGIPVSLSLKQNQAPLARPEPFNMGLLTTESFRIPHPGRKARVIVLIPGQITTRMVYEAVRAMGGFVVSDVESDILKLCVVERHSASGHVGLALVRGFGLRRGAIASSVAHDSHNVIVVGVSDGEIFKAVETVRVMGGGLAVISGDEVLARTPLEIGGLMSRQPLESLVEQLRKIKEAAFHLGCGLEEPFMTLSFLALPVVPELKVTDLGLVDVGRFEIVSLFPENS